MMNSVASKSCLHYIFFVIIGLSLLAVSACAPSETDTMTSVDTKPTMARR
jgi:hypothetical protein